MSAFGRAVLRLFARDPALVSRRADPPPYSRELATATLRRVHPAWESRVRGRTVVDFGCGHGHQAAALLEAGAARVLCLETSPERLADTRALLSSLRLLDRAELATHASAAHLGAWDLVLSQDSMEHFADPAAVLALMKRLVKPGGTVLVTFGPPWYAPYGAHHHFFLPLPWAHLLFSEDSVMGVRAAYRDDGGRRYSDVDGGLNRMSLAKFERLVAEGSFHVRERNYEAVKRQAWLAAIPVLRELFVSHVTVLLEPSDSRPAPRAP